MKTTTTISKLIGKLQPGDTFHFRADVKSIEDNGYIHFGNNGSAINGYIANDEHGSAYHDNEVLIDEIVLQRNVDEAIEIDGKPFSKATIKAALRAYVA